MAAYIDEERPDCILPSLPGAKSATLLALCFTRLNPVTIPTVRIVLMNTKRRFRKLYAILFPTADHIVTVSDGVADNAALKLGIPRERISRIYNPVVSAEIAELARAVPDHPWMSDDGPPVILGAGRLARVKDFPTLLRAFRRVSRNREVRLIILGEGSWRRRLENMIRKMGLQEKVSLPGWVPNPYAFMSRASLFVLSSKQEGLPGVLIQALACGCPCVSTNCPAGPAEILDNGRFGPLVPVGNDSALAEAMERVLDSPPDKDALLARAQEFSFDASVELYERMIRQSGARASPSTGALKIEEDMRQDNPADDGEDSPTRGDPTMKVFVINLARACERRRRMEEQFASLDLVKRRFTPPSTLKNSHRSTTPKSIGKPGGGWAFGPRQTAQSPVG